MSPPYHSTSQTIWPPDERRNHPWYLRLLYTLEDIILDINWIHVAFKICAYTYIAFMAWIAWHILPLQGHWSLESTPLQHVRDMSRYFDSFQGNIECKIRGHDLYPDHLRSSTVNLFKEPICADRESLLEALSSGGRIGYDAPYISRNCQYNWYDVHRICMIMERFDGIIFMGDESLQPIYSGLNILLRQDLLHGALQTSNINTDELAKCVCDNQFIRPSCSQNVILSSDQISGDHRNTESNTKSLKSASPYQCSRIPHAILKLESSDIDSGTIPETLRERFHILAPARPASFYKHIPIIISMSPFWSSSHNAIESARTTLQSILTLASSTGRKTDVLLLTPTAPGHVMLKHYPTSQDVWMFHEHMANFARSHGIDVLGMWNLTIQANSFDGIRFTQSVALTQTMMVMNWLSRLETS